MPAHVSTEHNSPQRLINMERRLFDCLCSAQNRRGGRVKLLSILLPETEFNHKDKVIIHYCTSMP